MFNGMEYVYKVYKEKSFSKAAQNLYIAQPSLSASIKKIEARIGSLIFDRSTTPIRLTECGEKYIRSVEKIMEIEHDFSNYLSDVNSLKTGQIAIGGSNLFTSFLMPPIVLKFREKYPNIQISMLEANTTALEEALSCGTLDIVADNNLFDEQIYEKHLFCREYLILTVPRSFASNDQVKQYQLSAHDIASGKHLEDDCPSVSLVHFKNDPFIFMKSGNDTRTRSDKLCRKCGFTPDVILKLDQQITAYNIACYGMGIAFISDTLAKNVHPDHNIVFYKLEYPYASRNLYFYHKRSKYMTHAMKEFLRDSVGWNGVA